MKKLSVITINYNNRDGLLRTIKSVVGQTCRDFEYIVIDGGSTDGSVDVIKEYADYIDYWVSEPDKGIYNAMNKGVRAAHGEFCQFLNSGDWYDSNIVVEAVLPCLSDEVDILSGYTVAISSDGRYERQMAGSPRHLQLYSLLTGYVSHPSSFIRRQLLLKRPYDETLKIVADWKFFVEVLVEDKAKYCHIDFDVALFDTTGISSQNPEIVKNEGELYRCSLIHPNILDEIRVVPKDVVYAFRRISESRRMQAIIVGIVQCCVFIYGIFKRSAIKNVNAPVIYPFKNRSKKDKISYRHFM